MMKNMFAKANMMMQSITMKDPESPIVAVIMVMKYAKFLKILIQ